MLLVYSTGLNILAGGDAFRGPEDVVSCFPRRGLQCFDDLTHRVRLGKCVTYA
jgi:hypothetical protein